MNAIYTLGYGLLKGPHAERKLAFQKRLRKIQDEIGKPLEIVDIRRDGARSRNGHWFDQGRGGHGMAHLIEMTGWVYLKCPDLANIFKSTNSGMRAYRWRLQHWADDLCVRQDFQRVAKKCLYGRGAVMLLCAERDALKPNGHTPNCHRVILAEELLNYLGDDWKVIHL